MRILFIAGAIVWIAGCSAGLHPTGTKEFDRAAFRQARAKWENAGITSYTFESRYMCFCPAHLNVWTRLTVRRDKVVAADPVAPLPPGISSDLLGWRTVPEIFEWIESAASSSDDMVSKVTVTYDEALGYPRDITIRCVPTVADCDRDFHLQSLARTP